MTLYKSIFITKRIFVALSILLFIGCGFLTYYTIVTRFTRVNETVLDNKPEYGFGPLNNIQIRYLQLPSEIKNSTPRFSINTISGNLDADNQYPKEYEVGALANVFLIEQKAEDINTSTLPIRIAENLKISDGTQTLIDGNSVYRWRKDNIELYVDGKYSVIRYKNYELRDKFTSNPDSFLVTEGTNTTRSENLKSLFEAYLAKSGISQKLDEYNFVVNTVIWDEKTQKFILNSDVNSNKTVFYRITAIRKYQTNSKLALEKPAPALAAYTDYYGGTNYLVLTTLSQVNNSTDITTNLVEMYYHNWPINESDIKSDSKDVQTYRIIVPRAAYDDLVKNFDKYVVAIKNKQTNTEINSDDLKEIKTIGVFRVRLDFYEDITNTKYIHPIYVFICEAETNLGTLEMIYYIKALSPDSYQV
ncbi:MAG: hypothetical protein N3A71_00760 [Candidatus Dojkabacteria bacterium]|nr:hypothetical protein [Candidatus Dojkabacteria bacterium]